MVFDVRHVFVFASALADHVSIIAQWLYFVKCFLHMFCTGISTSRIDIAGMTSYSQWQEFAHNLKASKL